MKRFGPYLIILTLAILLGGSLFPQVPGGVRAGESGPTVGKRHAYLPLVIGGSGNAQPGSVELINQAVAAGKISAETGLIYKVYATFSDPRLPAAYRGSGIGPHGDGVIRQVMSQAATLSPEATRILAPFFVPADRPGSWYEQQQVLLAAETGSPQAVSVTWSGLDAVNGRVRILWPQGFASGPALAAGLKTELEARIWPQLTTLMGADPLPDESGKVRIFLWHSYTESDGTVVPFASNVLGVAVPGTSGPFPATIYLNHARRLGNATTPGLITTLSHEFMHAIQYGMGAQSWTEYGWVMESLAVWAEDYVYPNANSEWELAPQYMNQTEHALKFVGADELRQYGTYLLPYLLTHTMDPTAAVVRRIWENAATMDNSYLAIRAAVPAASRDHYWGAFMYTLWNKAPFMEYYKNADKLTASVKPQQPAPVQVTAGSQPFNYQLAGSWPTGGIRYYHFTFPDASVRSLTLLNGLSHHLRQGPVEDVDYGPVLPADKTYLSTESPDEQAAGLTMVGMMKVAGQSGWKPVLLSPDLRSFSYCFDLEGKIEELVIAISSADWENPTRTMQPQGRSTTLYATNMPCWEYRGTSRITSHNAGVTWTYSASNVTYGDPYEMLVPMGMTFPVTTFYLMGADVAWSVSGTDSIGCTYSGSGSFAVSEHLGHGSDSIILYDGILPGGPTYRGYYGQGAPDEGTEVEYTVTCDDGSDTFQDYPAQFLYIPLYENRANVKVAANGTLSGSYQEDLGYGDYIRYEWNLTPRTK
jgi:hypothetical protein